VTGLGRDLGMWGWHVRLDDWTSIDYKLGRLICRLDLDYVHRLR
jgi:hypothetical protein